MKNHDNIPRSLNFWSEHYEIVASKPGTDYKEGLASKEAERRIKKYRKNLVTATRIATPLRLLLYQFKSPIVLLLMAAAILSYLLEDPYDAIIIVIIVFISAGLGFWQENGATNTIRRLLALVKLKSDVLRDRKEQEISSEDIVPGDIVILRAGDRIPGDCRLVESRNLFVNEAFLTGESYPVEKIADTVLHTKTAVSKRVNCVFMGSYVISGMAKALVVSTGTATELGKISSRLKTAKPETDFERGVAIWLLFGRDHINIDYRKLCCKCLSSSLIDRLISFFSGSGNRFDSTAATCNNLSQHCSWCKENKFKACYCQAACIDRKSW
jgi:Mg2+-importing ATPase